MTTATAVSTTGAGTGKGLRAGLWVAQGVLALVFGFAGFMKLVNTEAMVAQAHLSAGTLIFIGIAEVAGALGIVLPALTRIQPGLTPLAGIGLAIVMVLATGFNIMHGQMGAIGMTVVLGALAVFVAWGRWRKAPIAPRG